jgi:hypothetical protein
MAYKTTQHKGAISGVVADALSELQSLRDEVQEIVDNASGTGLENTQRIQTLSETADTLGNYVDNEPDVPGFMAAEEVQWHEMHNARKGRGDSRDTRNSNAVQALQAAADAAEAIAERLEQKESATEAEQEQAGEARSYAEEVRDISDNVESVEYPGMFG